MHAFGPALDDAVERELRRFVALVGAVEYRAVDQGAFVLNLDGIGRGRGRAGTRGQFLVDQAGSRLDCARFLGRSGEIGGGGVLFALQHEGRAALRQTLNLRSPRLQVDSRLPGIRIGKRALDQVKLGG